MLAAATAAVAMLALGGAMGHPRPRTPSIELARLSTMVSSEITSHGAHSLPLWERLLRPILAALAIRVQPRWAGMSRDDLRRAGIDPERLTIEELVALKGLCGAGCAALIVAVATLVPSVLILLPAAAFGGFVAPSVVITRRRLHRQRQILRELPDFLGLLKAFVSAGIPMEQALHLLSSHGQGDPSTGLLHAEIRGALSSYGLGLSINEALEAMARHTGIEELELFVAALGQGKRQGRGMDRILRDQETVIRMQQRNRAAAAASRVGTRLMGIVVLVYLPEFMLLIMVPLFYGIFLRAFG